ncbi:UL13 protein [Gallid alphaherpesvirus 3]|uniref:UL13 protein n=2 Tax=Gallid alphaherpesvirus 3 TaxID=35250 RepID=Q782T3_9ALPH|nr:tegument serine/threonine protein kinase [Gallid alphaherpesvirus 3]YP_010795606.1 UL13-like protein [Gallid alphaherpesvirus 3]BAA82907.1 UL13 product homolog [Marek's disease virus serotype 2 MDV2]AEI00215.1 UL13-like protein [Gallid alphaherpesvirus 3]QEY02237.1 UL13-like protein [Gallid alphaherpesvirus 3]BAB16521.1 UL13 protein [Gallid alphaherpesvirus 3]
MDLDLKARKPGRGRENDECPHVKWLSDISDQEDFSGPKGYSSTTDDLQGTFSAPRRDSCRKKDHKQHISVNIRRCLKQFYRRRKHISRKTSDILLSRPSLPDHIFTLSRIKNITSLIFDISPGLHYSTIDLQETPIYAGSGSYGEVKVFKGANVAVKKVFECFKTELLMTLIAGECACRARSTLALNSVISLLAFSIPSRELVFPAYDMDMDSYCHRLRKMDKTARHWRAIEKAFMGLGRAVVYLNVSCGLTHLDIKCGNIFVNVREGSNPIIVEAVIGDFSLALLNTNSTITKARFDITVDSDRVYSVKVSRANIRPVFDLVLGHGQTQPCELLVKALNGTGLERGSSQLSSDEGVAIDMYALGQSLMEVLLAAGMNFTRDFAIPGNPVHFYYHKMMPADYLLDMLAYRCMLYQYLFPATPLTAKIGIPWERAEKIRSQLHGSHHRVAFEKYLEGYEVTHRKLFDSLRVPPYLSNLFELVALYCHSNSEARAATRLLWK